MDLYSSKDKTLILNCISVKKQQILYDKNLETTKKATLLEHYEQLSYFLSSNDISNFNLNLKSRDYDLIQEDPYELAEKHINITKQLFLDSGKYSDKKFEEFLEAFFKNNEDLLEIYKIKNTTEVEKNSLINSSNSINSPLTELRSLVHQPNAKNMSFEEFKNWATKFRDCTKAFGINKFQEYFKKDGKSIADMQISYDSSNPEQDFYKLDFTLIDNTAQESNSTLTEKKQSMTYLQNLCYSYLEANKFAQADLDLINSTSIPEVLNDFTKCYETLKDFEKCVIDINNGNLFYLGYTEFSPTKEENKNSITDNTDENILEI